MNRILVTGIHSYLGTSLKKYLEYYYPREYTIDLVSVRGDNWKIPSGYDVLFHVAGIAHTTGVDSKDYQIVNSDLAERVAIMAKKAGISQFIFMSSSMVYNNDDKKEINKNTNPNPNTEYGKSKLEAEKRLLSLENETFKICIIRSPMVYGAGCKGNYPRLRNIALKTLVFPRISNMRSMIYVENLMEFVRQLIKKKGRGIYWAQNREYVNTSELVRTIAAVHGKKVFLVPGLGWIVDFLGIFSNAIRKASSSMVYDQTLSKYDFNYDICSFIESIRRTEEKD